ncbi:hypothetical protein WICMUC_000503 [Wickerhamomyces mucosus]|uniref:Uncharacterized protein n=1 Tax=Wickerhamomyces mucosus TaxID=1378264 RepID=A0A9P8PZ16_9ASCO|nr:hypothetical protein WICMUC_000503 [Wickerhamomyces mucosus]
MTSSVESNGIIAPNGPNVSSDATFIDLLTLDKTLGAKKLAPKSSRRPPFIKILAPFSTASLICSSTLTMALPLIKAP